MRFLLLILTLFSLPLHAQELLPKYQVLGYIDLVMEGEERQFPIIALDGRSFANKYQLDRESGMFKYRLAGVSVRSDGEWDYPMISVNITTHNEESGRSTYIAYATGAYGADYIFRSRTPDPEKTAAYDAFVEDETGLVEFTFRGQLVHYDVDGNAGTFTPQEGKAPVDITGRVSVTIPAEYRED